MKVQKFVVTIATSGREDSVGVAKADEIRRAICALYGASTVIVDAEKETPDITDWPHILTENEVGELQKYAAKIHWGFNRKTLTAQIRKFEKGSTKTKCKVYFLLEDCNFHEVAGLLAEGKVKGAYEWANTQID